jgi:general secretion pathway protein C
MVSYLSWAANAVLFVAACYLAANTANTIFAAMLAPPEPSAVIESTPTSAPAANHDHRRAILERNLFQSTTVAVRAVEEPVDELEATTLPLDLLGTAAAENPELAWAAVLDRDQRQTLVVGVGDRLKDKADVVRIERRRLVLLENGAHRELTFGDEPRDSAAVIRASARSARRTPTRDRSTSRSRPSRTTRNRISREEVDEALRDPSDILSQARFLPKYDGGEMRGFQVNAIKPDSVLKELGLQNGDVITEFNGISISSPQESAKLLQELGQSTEFSIQIERADGSVDTIDADLE